MRASVLEIRSLCRDETTLHAACAAGVPTKRAYTRLVDPPPSRGSVAPGGRGISISARLEGGKACDAIVRRSTIAEDELKRRRTRGAGHPFRRRRANAVEAGHWSALFTTHAAPRRQMRRPGHEGDLMRSRQSALNWLEPSTAKVECGHPAQDSGWGGGGCGGA